MTELGRRGHVLVRSWYKGRLPRVEMTVAFVFMGSDQVNISNIEQGFMGHSRIGRAGERKGGSELPVISLKRGNMSQTRLCGDNTLER